MLRPIHEHSSKFGSYKQPIQKQNSDVVHWNTCYRGKVAGLDAASDEAAAIAGGRSGLGAAGAADDETVVISFS